MNINNNMDIENTILISPDDMNEKKNETLTLTLMTDAT